MYTAMRSWRDRSRSDEGLSLVEVIVTIGLTSLVGVFTFQLLMMGIRSTSDTAVRQDNAGQARVAIEAMSKTIRAAVRPSQIQGLSCKDVCVTAAAETAVTAARTTSISFYANVNGDGNGPSRVKYEVRGTELVETVEEPTRVSATEYTYCATAWESTCTFRTRVLARGLVAPTATAPLFGYFQANGSTLTLPATTTPADLDKIDSVDILAKIRTSTRWGTPATTVTMRVALPNADYARPAPTGGP
jgi:type II secretory pathway component PulJ